MRAVVEIWLKSLIDEFTLGGLHSALLIGSAHCSLTLQLNSFPSFGTFGFCVFGRRVLCHIYVWPGTYCPVFFQIVSHFMFRSQSWLSVGHQEQNIAVLEHI